MFIHQNDKHFKFSLAHIHYIFMNCEEPLFVVDKRLHVIPWQYYSHIVVSIIMISVVVVVFVIAITVVICNISSGMYVVVFYYIDNSIVYTLAKVRRHFKTISEKYWIDIYMCVCVSAFIMRPSYYFCSNASNGKVVDDNDLLSKDFASFFPRYLCYMTYWYKHFS